MILLAKSDWADYARSLDLFDEVIAVDVRRFYRSLSYKFGVVADLCRLGVATVIQTRAAREFLLEDYLVRLIGAPRTIGTEGIAVNIGARVKRLTDRWYRERYPALPLWEHEISRNAVFTRQLTGEEVERLSIPVGKTSESAGAQPYFVMAPGASWPDASAALTIETPIRSLTEFAGL